MGIPNPIRHALAHILSILGAGFGVLSVMKLFEALGLVWIPALSPIINLGSLPAEPIQQGARLIGRPLPSIVVAVVSSYLLMGLYFAWLTRMFMLRSASNPDVGYIKRANQEAAISVITWPVRFASDLSNPTFWQLSPWYVFRLLAFTEILLAVCLMSGLARFTR